MTRQTTRRDMLKESDALAGLGFLGLPEWAFPALSQGATLVPFTDLPETLTLERSPVSRIIDHHGSALLEEWIAGKSMAAENSSERTLWEAGNLLGRLSQVTLPPELTKPKLLKPDHQLARTLRHLSTLADRGQISRNTAEKLEKTVVENFPSCLDTGLVHRDFCADNLVINMNGALFSIDNEDMRHGYLDADLARSWYRWPMETWQRNEFISGYESHRKIDKFLANEWYWSIRTLCASAYYRTRWQLPIAIHVDCLMMLAAGDPRGLWPNRGA